jgi:hypothetical protein
VCATTPSAPDNPCIACLDGPAQIAPDGGTTACDTQISNACKADPNCVAWDQCQATCPP